ncbi:MAG: hypothetical protein ABSD67_20540 [Terracidiphilus sp.]|jgi:hypothetical protein
MSGDVELNAIGVLKRREVEARINRHARVYSSITFGKRTFLPSCVPTAA